MAFLVNTYIIDDHADNFDSADILWTREAVTLQFGQ